MSRYAREEWGRMQHYKNNKMSGITTELSIIT
jgi:hypothetical protein